MRNTGPAFRYAIAIFVAAAALYLRYLLTPLLGSRNPYHTVWVAVVFSAWYCGFGPSIVATVLETLGVWYWFLPPQHSFAIQNRSDAYGLVGFMVFSGAIIALGESNRRGFAARSGLAAIVDSSNDAIIGISLKGVITSWNKGAERLFGYSAEEAVGQHIRVIVPPELQSEDAMIIERLRRGESIGHFETVRVRKDGTKLDVSLAISPTKDSIGRVVGASKVMRDITDQKQAEEAVKEKELSARLRKLQDEERRRMARELHDGVGQLLAAMSMNASKIKCEEANLSPEGARCATENYRLVEQVSRDIRTMSYLMHPPLLDEMGLDFALKWYIDGFSERSKIATNLEVPEDWVRLPQDHELCLFRFVQECLTNIHRHSRSTTARVKLLRSPGEIRLEVNDEGKGLTPETQAKITSGETVGVGLRGMRGRVKELGGSMEIRSNGHGVTVIAMVPLAESGEAERESVGSPMQRAASQMP